MAITNGPVERQDVSIWTNVCSFTVAAPAALNGAIGNGATGTATFTSATAAVTGSSTAGLPNVQLGDQVTVAPAVDMQNVLFAGYVNVAGTVTVSYSNNTGGSKTLGAHNITCLVQRFQPDIL